MRSLTLLTHQSLALYGPTTAETAQRALAGLSLAETDATPHRSRIVHPDTANTSPVCNDTTTGDNYHLVCDTETSTLWLARSRYPGPSDSTSPPACQLLLPLSVPVDAQLVGFQYLLDLDALFIAFEQGDILLLREASSICPDGAATAAADLLDPVGDVVDGILATSWSPDEEVLLVITGRHHLIMMTKDFDVLTEFPIYAESEGHEASVSVGWGKKETQFHGSAGKAAAQQTRDLSRRRLGPHDDRRPRLAWRGDATYFVCSTVDRHHQQPEPSEHRTLRVYSREGELMHTGEAIDCLESALCWKPSGGLIATSEQLPHRHDIIFWERNGLRHGEFSLREPAGTAVRALQWNTDSTVLAAILERAGQRYIQLWADKNYHWYLVQQIGPITDGEWEDPILDARWDPELPLVLHITTRAGQQRHRYAADYLFGHARATAAGNSLSVACVVDGAQVKVTPFSVANVPPPMCHLTLDLPHPVRTVAFRSALEPTGTTTVSDYLAVLGTNPAAPVRLYGLTRDPTRRHIVTAESLVDLPEFPAGLVPRQVVYPRANTLVVLAHDLQQHCDVLVRADFSGPELGGTETPTVIAAVWSTPAYPTGPESANLLRLVAALDSADVFVETAVGTVYQVDYDRHTHPVTLRTTQPFCHLPEPCPWLYVMAVGPAADAPTVSGDALTVIARSDRNRLYLDRQQLSGACISLFVHDHFILYTTSDHYLRLLPRTLDAGDLLRLAQMVPMAGANADADSDLTQRRVERGARLACAVNGDTTVVLQMPRGNLETVQPRALVLAAVRQAIDRKDYRQAFILARKHRIDLNLLFDHNPTQFRAMLPAITRQIEEPDYLNLLLSALQDENVCATKYPPRPRALLESAPAAAPAMRDGFSMAALESMTTPAEPLTYPGKRRELCAGIQRELEALNDPRYLPSIITASVCKDPGSLDEAVRVLIDLRDRGVPVAELEDTLQYLLFLVDVDKVYHAALAAYDLPLALLTAQFSQKDPKEYLAFLSELQRLDEPYRRFKINDYLERPAEALPFLVQTDTDRDEELQLGRVQDVGAKAKEDSGGPTEGQSSSLLRHQPRRFDEVFDYVVKHHLYIEVLDLYRDRPIRHRRLCGAFADHLSEQRQHARAGGLYVLAENWVEAVKSYRRAGKWDIALALAAQHRHHDLGTATSPTGSGGKSGGGGGLYELARDIAQRLEDKHRYREAAQIYLDYTPETETAVQVLVRGSDWLEAVRIAHLRSRTDLIETHVMPGINDALDALHEEVGTLTDQWHEQLARVREIRRLAAEAEAEAKRVAAAAAAAGNDDDHDEEAAGFTMAHDAVSIRSEASTQITRFTRYTAAPSTAQLTTGSMRSGKTTNARSRRKEAKKSISGKRGGPAEEIYLLESIARLISPKLGSMATEIGALAHALTILPLHQQRPIKSPVIHARSHSQSFGNSTSGAEGGDHSTTTTTTAAVAVAPPSLPHVGRRAAAIEIQDDLERLFVDIRARIDEVYDPDRCAVLKVILRSPPTPPPSTSRPADATNDVNPTSSPRNEPLPRGAQLGSTVILRPIVPQPEWRYK